MKRLVLGFAMVCMSTFTFAQSSYEAAMTARITKMEAAKSPEDFTASAHDFKRIADKEKNQWLPFYYTALAHLQKARLLMRTSTAQLDEITAEADKNIAEAERLSPENAEIYLLKKMSHSLKMMVKPMERFRTEGAAAQSALQKAKALDPENPRATLLEAEDTYFTPEEYGGSKTRGIELFKKSSEQFKTYTAKSPMHPNWGKSEADYFATQKAN